MKIRKTICLIIAACSIISFLISTTASALDVIAKHDETECSFDVGSYDNLAFVSDNEVYNHGSSINASYILYSDTDSPIDDFAYTSSGFSVESISIDENDDKRINVTISCIEGYEECSFNLEVEYGNETQTAHLYAAVNEHGIFTSSVSCEAAVNVYYTHAIENGIMTEEDYREILNEQSRQYVTIEEINGIHSITPSANINSTSDTGDTYVYGTLRWVDDNGYMHMLRGVKVEIWEDNLLQDNLLGTTNSNVNGVVSFAFTNGSLFDQQFDIYMRIFPGDDNVMVKQFQDATAATGERDYYIETEVVNNVTTGSTIACNAMVRMNSELGHAFQISQAVMATRNYATQMNGSQLGAVKVFYPNNNPTVYENNTTPDNEKCFYRSTSAMISIGGATTPENNINVDNGLSGYSSWDVLMHEYGHHVEHCLGLSDLVGGEHGFGRDLAVIEREDGTLILVDKTKATQLAWSEALATMIGKLAQDYYSSQISDIEFCNDTRYDSYNGAAINFESIPDTPSRPEDTYFGESNEGAILGVLWDLYDPANEDCDPVALGNASFWSLINQMNTVATKNFSAFVSKLFIAYPSQIENIKVILAEYKMIPTDVRIINPSLMDYDVSPIIRCFVNGSNVNRYNLLRIVFLDNNGTERNSISMTNTNEQLSYTIPAEIWDTILSSYGTKFQIVIEAYHIERDDNQNEISRTGPYISQKSIIYTKPTPTPITESFTVGSSASNSRYVEKIATTEYPSQKVEYNITFNLSGNVIFQTFGNKNMYITLCDASGNVLETDQYDGYKSNSLISYTVTAGTQYKLKMQFYYADITGTMKLGIFYHEDLEYYENFYSPTAGWLAVRVDFPVGSVYAIRMKVTTDTTVRFDVTLACDSYLYVIDPSSTAAISTSSNAASQYDDDGGGNFQASLTMTLKANVDYLIIVSAYNPLANSATAGRLNATVVVDENND